MTDSSASTPFKNQRGRLIIRNATTRDVPAIADLSTRAYAGTGMHGYSEGALTGQINNFPQGQFVATVEDKLVGYCATFRIAGEVALKPHTWESITGS